MNRGSLVRILLTMALVGDGVGLATALSEQRTLLYKAYSQITVKLLIDK